VGCWAFHSRSSGVGFNWPRKGKSETERRASARQALEFEPPAHYADELFGQRQAHPDPLRVASETAVDLREGVIQCFEPLRGDAAACVCDRELHGTGHRKGRLDADVDRTALGKFGGVVEEQSQDLPDLVRVALRLRMQVR